MAVCRGISLITVFLFVGSQGLRITPSQRQSDVELWEGLEMETRDVELQKDIPHPHALTAESTQRYVLLGPQDSGTNLLEEMIHSNFGDQVIPTHRLPSGELWKHSNSGASDIYKVLAESMPFQSLEKTTAIMMIRSPISQVVSWKAHPYEMAQCFEHTTFKDMGKACSAPVKARRSGRMYFSDSKENQVWFKTHMEIHNHFMRQYRQIQKDNKFKKAVIIPYEDAVYDPEKTVQILAEALGLPEPTEVKVVNKGAKDISPGRAAALKKLTTRSYLSEIDAESLKIMCGDLDYELNDHIIEGGTSSEDANAVKVPYSHDCRQFK